MPMPIYGKVEKPEDIRRINCIIRDELLEIDDKAKISELKKRSDYLCTLTYSPFWKKKFGDQIEILREIAIEENRVTVRECNIIAKYHNLDVQYNPWKKEINIDDMLKKLPSKILDEINHTMVELSLKPEILEELRKLYCEIRKGMVLSETEEYIKKFIHSVNVMTTLPHLKNFQEHFDEVTIKLIDALILKETNRSIKLANIISEVNNWDLHFETITNENIEDKTIEEYLNKLLEDESKADTYIPTEHKYKGEGKVLWLVYEHSKRKREYARRIYFPANIRNIKMEGPDWFVNKFGNKVWGVKITYESKIDSHKIRIHGKDINLPEKWVHREKIIPLPKEAVNIRLLDTKPQSAMNIA